MPLWVIYHPDGTFEDDASKEPFAKDITKFYSEKVGLPAFYVSVCFVKLSNNTLWVGGEKRSREKPFIRLVIEHIAVNLPDDDAAFHHTAENVNSIMKPHIADKGYSWEFHIDETDRRLWRIDGLVPPPWKSEEEKIWFRENKATPLQK